MIISISGIPGSGKTSVAKILADRLKMRFYSMGGLRGKMALERGMTLDELNALGEKDPITDTTVDEYQRELGKKEDDFVIEGRLSWHFIPNSFKVFLDCNTRAAAERIFRARQNILEGRADEPVYESIENTQQLIEKRMASDDRRYEKYYSVNYRDPKNYDLVLDTTTIQGAEKVAEAIQAKLPTS